VNCVITAKGNSRHRNNAVFHAGTAQLDGPTLARLLPHQILAQRRRYGQARPHPELCSSRASRSACPRRRTRPQSPIHKTSHSYPEKTTNDRLKTFLSPARPASPSRKNSSEPQPAPSALPSQPPSWPQNPAPCNAPAAPRPPSRPGRPTPAAAPGCSPIRRISAHSPGSVIRKAGSGTW